MVVYITQVCHGPLSNFCGLVAHFIVGVFKRSALPPSRSLGPVIKIPLKALCCPHPLSTKHASCPRCTTSPSPVLLVQPLFENQNTVFQFEPQNLTMQASAYKPHRMPPDSQGHPFLNISSQHSG